MTALAQALATVTPIAGHRTPRPGWLPYRWANAGRVYTGIHADMVRIEDQASTAFQLVDGDVDAATVLLTSAGCRFTPDQVERLFELSSKAAHARDDLAPVDFYRAADDYADYLNHLAKESRKTVSA